MAHSRVVRLVKTGDVLYIGPDVVIKVLRNGCGMRLHCRASRHLTLVHEKSEGPAVTRGPYSNSYSAPVSRGDVLYIGPDVIVKLKNQPSDSVRLIISADTRLQIHHQKGTKADAAPDPSDVADVADKVANI